jgi:hypothetical protein
MWANQADARAAKLYVTSNGALAANAETPLLVSQACPSRRGRCGTDSEYSGACQLGFGLLWHDGRVNSLLTPPHKFDVTAFLPGFHESRCLKSTLDLAEWQGLKPPQPQPRRCEPLRVVWLAAARSGVPVLPSNWREPLLRSHLGWPHLPRGTEKHTSSLHARRSRRTVASCQYSFTRRSGFARYERPDSRQCVQ